MPEILPNGQAKYRKGEQVLTAEQLLAKVMPLNSGVARRITEPSYIDRLKLAPGKVEFTYEEKNRIRFEAIMKII